MNNTTTIHSEIEHYIRQQNLNITQFAHSIEINPGSMSSILNGNKVISVDQLDRVTAKMELPPGYFYEQYISEYVLDAPLNWRRIRPLITRCAELDKLECIKQILHVLMDNLSYATVLFEVAEELFLAGRRDAAMLLYENVALSEKSQHSERLALCHYRLFILRLGDNQVENMEAALQFEPFVDRLDEIDQLDALKSLANTYRALRLWDKLEIIVHKMRENAHRIYFSTNHSTIITRETLKKLSRPLFVYLTFSNLLLAEISEARGNYDQALQYTYAYANLDWVKEQEDIEIKMWVEKYKNWARANIYVNKLMSGDMSVLPEYIAYFESKEDEILPAILNIVEAANRYGINVDTTLERFQSSITPYIQNNEYGGGYSRQFILDHLAQLLYELAYYFLYKENFLFGFQYLLESLKNFDKMNNNLGILKCVRLFENFRNYATQEIQTSYQNLIKEGDNYEKTTYFVSSNF